MEIYLITTIKSPLLLFINLFWEASLFFVHFNWSGLFKKKSRIKEKKSFLLIFHANFNYDSVVNFELNWHPFSCLCRDDDDVYFWIFLTNTYFSFWLCFSNEMEIYRRKQNTQTRKTVYVYIIHKGKLSRHFLFPAILPSLEYFKMKRIKNAFRRKKVNLFIIIIIQCKFYPSI